MSIQRSDNKPNTSLSNEVVETALDSEKSYEAPVLVHFGDVRDITLGPTVGIGESGAELGFRNPP